MEIRVNSIQEAINLAVKEKSNVLVPCAAISDEEIRLAIKDSKGCHIFRKGNILVVPPEHMDTLGGTGPTIIGVPDHRFISG